MVISLRQGWEAETLGEKEGGVSGVRLGEDSTLTSCGRFKRGGGVYKKWGCVGGGGWVLVYCICRCWDSFRALLRCLWATYQTSQKCYE